VAVSVQALLVCPLLVATMVCQFVVTLTAHDMTGFIVAWMVTFAMMLVEKVHGEGIVKVFQSPLANFRLG